MGGQIGIFPQLHVCVSVERFSSHSREEPPPQRGHQKVHNLFGCSYCHILGADQPVLELPQYGLLSLIWSTNFEVLESDLFSTSRAKMSIDLLSSQSSYQLLQFLLCDEILWQ